MLEQETLAVIQNPEMQTYIAILFGIGIGIGILLLIIIFLLISINNRLGDKYE